LRTFVLTTLGRALRRLERLEPRSQIVDFPAQLGDLSALVDEFDGEAPEREAESLSAKLGADSRQVRLVLRGHVAVSRSGRARLCPSVCLLDAQCIGRLTLELDVKLRCSTSSTVVSRADASAAQAG
jgi:hypothetical protein